MRVEDRVKKSERHAARGAIRVNAQSQRGRRHRKAILGVPVFMFSIRVDHAIRPTSRRCNLLGFHNEIPPAVQTNNALLLTKYSRDHG